MLKENPLTSAFYRPPRPLDPELAGKLLNTPLLVEADHLLLMGYGLHLVTSSRWVSTPHRLPLARLTEVGVLTSDSFIVESFAPRASEDGALAFTPLLVLAIGETSSPLHALELLVLETQRLTGFLLGGDPSLQTRARLSAWIFLRTCRALVPSFSLPAWASRAPAHDVPPSPLSYGALALPTNLAEFGHLISDLEVLSRCEGPAAFVRRANFLLTTLGSSDLGYL